MSFRTRLTLFFVLIVVVPMIALGVVVSRLVSDSEQGKSSARGSAYATATVNAYRRLADTGARHARLIAADPALAAALRQDDAPAGARAARRFVRMLGLSRVVVLRDGQATATFVDLGDPTAIASGGARVRGSHGAVVEVSTTSAARFVRSTSLPGVHTAISRGGALLAASPALHLQRPPPAHGNVTLNHVDYTAATFHAADFGGSEDTIAVLTDSAGTSGAVARSRWLTVALLAGFLLLAFAGAVLISRQLQGQLARFLAAAKRIGRGDFTTLVPVEGGDEFAELGREFNTMSRELEQRLGELRRERARLRESIQRIGATFAANLDRSALVEIGAQTAVEAVEATCGRACIRVPDGDELRECARVGELAGSEAAIAAAEEQALASGSAAAASVGDVSALAAPIARAGGDPDTRLHGLLTVARQDRPFDEQERELLASLARQTGISLENVELHDQVQRQAVTDELTGLFNHGRFQQVIATEAAAAERFGQPLGLVMLDIDNFKRVNDTYGHPQGDVVLREVARVLRDCSREIDEPARYGGEEMAVALQQTDLDGALVIAERVRASVEALEVPRLDGGGMLRVTVSCGVAASTDGDKDALIAAADAALYRAKHAGKNRTVCADERAAAPR